MQSPATPEPSGALAVLRSRLDRRPVVADLVVLLVAVVLAYASAVPGGFVWIDRVEILEGGYRLAEPGDLRRLATLTLDQYLERRHEPTLSRGGYWRPVYALAVSLDWLLWRDRAAAWHAENIVWHALVVVGLYALARQALRDRPAARPVAFWAALLFAVHPLGVHSVTWISGRKDTLCAAFSVGALLAFHAASRAGRSGRRARGAVWAAASAALLLLALGCKELALMVPAVATAWLWLGRRPGERLPGTALAALAALWACSAGLVAYRATVLGGFGLHAPWPADSPLGNVATAATLWWHYVGRVLLPLHPSISDAWSISQDVGPAEALAIAGLAGAAGVLAWGLWRRAPWAFGLSWYVLWTLPASGIVPLRHVRAERYLYPASWGLLLTAAVVLFTPSGAAREERRLRAVRVALAAAAIALLLATALANPTWWSEQRLFADSVARDPRHAEGHLGLARLALGRGDYEGAIAHSRRGIAAGQGPSHTAFWSPFIAHTNLGLALYHSQQHKEALEQFELARRNRPNHAIAHYHLGLAAFALNDLWSAEKHYRHALELRPDDFLARSNLAVTLLHQRDPRGCIELLVPLVEQRPDDATNLANYASALLALGEFGQARPHLRRLVELAPDDAGHRAKLAWCLWELGQQEEARRIFGEARRLAPSHPTVRALDRVIR